MNKLPGLFLAKWQVAILVVGVLPALSACKSRVGSHLVSEAATPTDGDIKLDPGIEKLLREQTIEACAAMLFNAQQGELQKKSCDVAEINDICDLEKETLAESVNFLADDPIAQKNTSTTKQRVILTEAITADFLNAANQCFNAEAFRQVAVRRAAEADPALIAKRAAARQRFWKRIALATGPMIATGASFKYIGSKAPQAFKQMIIAQFCAAGFNVVQNFASSSEVNWNDDQCGDLRSFFAARAKNMSTCAETAATLCLAGGGFVDFNNVPGLQTDNDYVNFVTSLASTGASTACLVAGPWTAVACGVINQSAAQISKSLATGSNDWGECVGTAAIGRCIGQRYANGGWSNNQAIAMPEKVTDRRGDPWWVRDCCLCDAVDYEDTGRVIYWTAQTAKRPDLSVIQHGDFATGNCGTKSGKQHRNPYNNLQYTQYENCRRTTVIGGRCSLYDSQNGELTPGKVALWNRQAKMPTGRTVAGVPLKKY